ncbi:GNAT family N-acetyltransferase [Chryseobacterium indoltheticum]|uniref:GNAT family N-acetyltransferase n=1 Tax=Chryseobacterium indoltheticum TaxID=254 RepID=UPI001912A6FB|nr:GNAT family N-acetyltransferase [Chryseobacterium indoltheticum]QQQ30106.1 GNAT family N-acetyltransferase [Chryseobacterium indoltheticum]
MSYTIRIAITDDYPKLVKIWESSVKATHDFLSESDFQYFKKVIPKQYFPHLEVYIISENSNPKGFGAVSGDTLEMLFVHNDARGNGLGKILYQYLHDKTGCTKVDVNEQNPQAIGFYEKMGFRKTGRSEKDGSGKDYPLIHMSL